MKANQEPVSTAKGYLFDPPGVAMWPADQRLAKCRLLVNLFAGGMLLLVLAFLWWAANNLIDLVSLTGSETFATVISGFLLGLWVVWTFCWFWLFWLIPRQVKNRAWVLTTDSVYVRKGYFFQSLTMMPVGRLQFAEANSGPVQRLFGISEIEITGAAEDHLIVPGIPAEQARQVVQQLRQSSNQKLAGL